jgi:hypothetical protein
MPINKHSWCHSSIENFLAAQHGVEPSTEMLHRYAKYSQVYYSSANKSNFYFYAMQFRPCKALGQAAACCWKNGFIPSSCLSASVCSCVCLLAFMRFSMMFLRQS